jgi:pre-rRNA-processing protein TSR4
LTPQLLTYLEIDNKPIDSLDWGTLLIYTCNSHCDAANGKYAKEFIVKQQFSSAGLGDSIRKQLDNRK